MRRFILFPALLVSGVLTNVVPLPGMTPKSVANIGTSFFKSYPMYRRSKRGSTGPATAVNAARKVYALYGVADKLAIDDPWDYNRLPDKTQDRIVEWMSRNLKSAE